MPQKKRCVGIRESFMFRFYYTIVMRIGSIIHFVPKMRKYAKHPEIYSEEDCHELAKIMIAKVAKTIIAMDFANAGSIFLGLTVLKRSFLLSSCSFNSIRKARGIPTMRASA